MQTNFSFDKEFECKWNELGQKYPELLEIEGLKREQLDFTELMASFYNQQAVIADQSIDSNSNIWSSGYSQVNANSGRWAINETNIPTNVTNIPAVAIITHPMIKDFVAAAPTKPNIISKLDIGAASNSYIVPVNLGK
jgi:hypothetical protein